MDFRQYTTVSGQTALSHFIYTSVAPHSTSDEDLLTFISLLF